MVYDNFGTGNSSGHYNLLESALKLGNDANETNHTKTAASWSDISAGLTSDAFSNLKSKTMTASVNDSFAITFDQRVNQRKTSGGVGQESGSGEGDNRPGWLVNQVEMCRVERQVEKEARIAPGAFGRFSSCTYKPEEIRKVALPVDANGDVLYASSTAAKELPKIVEALRKGLTDPDKYADSVFDLIARDRVILSKREFGQLVNGINAQFDEWGEDRKVLPDGTMMTGNEQEGKSYYSDHNGNFTFKTWGPKPEQNSVKTRTVTADGGYQEIYKTNIPKQGYGLRFRPDYSYTLLYADGTGQSRDSRGNISSTGSRGN
jgi:hypothetical protein